MENKKPPSPTKLVCFKSFANPEANELSTKPNAYSEGYATSWTLSKTASFFLNGSSSTLISLEPRTRRDSSSVVNLYTPAVSEC